VYQGISTAEMGMEKEIFIPEGYRLLVMFQFIGIFQ
jgi:hypothetical protein